LKNINDQKFEKMYSCTLDINDKILDVNAKKVIEKCISFRWRLA